MRAYGCSMLPAAEASCFCPLKPDPVSRIKPQVTRVQFCTSRTRKATIRASASAAAAATVETSFYELLGIPESGTLLEIKQAYKQLARKYHPDVSPPDRVQEYTQRFIRVQEAYETLSDPNRRALYDRDMGRGFHLALSVRKRYPYQNDEDMVEKSEWKNQWQSQLSELKRRSMHKEANGNMSWAARMRKQREEL